MKHNFKQARDIVQSLNLPTYTFSIRREGGKAFIFDPVRKKHVRLTPEEWVRQHFIQYLVQEKNYPAPLCSVERPLSIHDKQFKADIVFSSRQGKPFLIVECKAPTVKITEDVFYQVARYNMPLQVQYLIVTNGLKHYCCEMDYGQNSFRFLEDIPGYDREVSGD